VDENNPMYEVYPVTNEEAEVLQPYVDVNIDLSLYDYFVDADAKSV
jgi:hypothetical protein